MLKMIIADDEYIVRDGLKTAISWEEFGIEVVAEAEDGEQALELCHSYHPDILLTDIRMPMLDGLEVAMKLKEESSKTHVIIVSGVQDFSYAKTALDVSAEAYILKPIQINELKEVVGRVVNSISLQQNKAREILNLKRQLHESMPLLRDKFIRSLVTGTSLNELEIRSKLQYFNIPVESNESLLVAFLQLDDYAKITEGYTEDDKQLLSFSVHNIVEEIVSNYSAGISACLSDNEFIIIFKQTALNYDKYYEVCQEIVSCINKFLNVGISIGLGNAVNGIRQLNCSYQNACTALQYKFYTGNNSIMDISDISQNNTDSVIPSYYEKESQLLMYMKSGDSVGIKKVFSDLFDLFSQNPHLDVEYVQSICVELTSIASRTLYELGESLESIVSKRSTIFEEIYKIENIFILRDYMISVFERISEFLSKKFTQKNSKTVSKIKDIIRQQFMKSIGVSEIAKEVYLSPNHISLIFKQETGTTITEYITSLRMETAKDLLKTTDFKILDVAQMVGYENPQYFSTVFKKYTGMHPQQFRTCAGD